MLYVLRDASGAIAAVFDQPLGQGLEPIEKDDAELVAFLDRIASEEESIQGRFARADLAFIRVLEDLISTLIDKGVVTLNDLPRDAQRKILERSGLREHIGSSMPVISDDAEVLL